ncbi:alpha/beta hydrolase [Flavobacteriaceae bacterium]|nr:alpha/beta hydrolase [Flavobacteriaceae bacterium]
MKSKLTFVPSLLVIILSLQACKNTKKQPETTAAAVAEEIKSETIVLVHSAWLGAWQWGTVAEELAAKGHTVIAPDLPGHGSDKTAPGDITMENYVKTITDILDAQTEPVVLVGHSFNGITISRAAELCPEKVKKLVYLTAFLLPNGGSFFGAVQGVEGSKAVENFYLSEDKTYALVKAEEIQTHFFSPCFHFSLSLYEIFWCRLIFLHHLLSHFCRLFFKGVETNGFSPLIDFCERIIRLGLQNTVYVPIKLSSV